MEGLDRPRELRAVVVPAPARCKVREMELRPGGAFEILISEDSGDFGPHLSACFLDVVAGERIVFYRCPAWWLATG